MSKINGLSKTRIYRIYHRMVYRCKTDKTCETYRLYRQNNITVCEEWLGENGFMNFYVWSMDNGYDDNLTIDRIDGTKGYSPNNCRWVSYKVQGNNTNRNRIITYKGKTQTMSEWADELGIPYQRLNSRINVSKMPLEDAFRKETMNNHSRGTFESKKISAFGEEKFLYELAEENGLNPTTITSRMRKGMSVEDAIKTRKYQKLSKSDLDSMFSDYYDGEPEEVICQKYGITSATLCRYRKRYGKPVRSKRFLYDNRKIKHGY